MNKHTRIVHELAGKSLNKCGDYEKAFKEEQDWKGHIRIVYEEKRINCPECDKPFVSKSTLKKHIDTVHEKKKPHVCDICHESFAQSYHLVTHKKGKHKILNFH